MAVAKAHKVWQDAKTSGQCKTVVNDLRKKYHTMRQRRTEKRKVMMQENAARNLQQVVQGQAPATFDDVVKVAHHLQLNIVVLNLDFQDSTPRNVEFQTRAIHDYGADTTLFVYREDNHYNAVTSIKAFTGDPYYSVECMIGARRKYSHRCPGDT